eukprot:gene18801-26606_t
MAIRRLQGNLGGYDSSRGLAVIMRYTLRLLTLQQFQRATALICAMEHIRREALAAGDQYLGESAFTIGLWVGNKVTPGTTEDSHKFIEAIRTPGRNPTGMASPAQLTGCPWCGAEIDPKRDIEVDKIAGRTTIYCGDKLSACDFSRGRSSKQAHPGLPVMVVDEEMYHRPPSMMIATVDKFAMMAWRGSIRNLFGRVSKECSRHGLLWPGSECNTGHRAVAGRVAATTTSSRPSSVQFASAGEITPLWLNRSLGIAMTDFHVPYMCLNDRHATSMPDTARPDPRRPSDLSQSVVESLVSISSAIIDTSSM